MKVLLVKTSSFGDIIHTLPAVTDLFRQVPGVELSWVIEESFQEIPSLNPKIKEIIPVAIRRWRKSWIGAFPEIKHFYHGLRKTEYDVVLDAQGLMKSALLVKMARGAVHGLDGQSSREPSSRFFYDESYSVDKNQHAVERVRKLFALVFNYELEGLPLDYGIDMKLSNSKEQKLFFLHGTTWASKHWPEARWREFALLSKAQGYSIRISYGNEEEKLRAERIVHGVDSAKIIKPGNISDLVREMSSCAGVVSVDTGLGHLATALNLPVVGIYGATNPMLTGLHGQRSDIIVSDYPSCIPCLKKECKFEEVQGAQYPPCYESTSADLVFKTLSTQILKTHSD
ncbi:MAG: heptosyltransferase-1 [Candidatus Azotimanducaceae bacterium]|jgi:heptosyltransferase-1